MEAQSRELLMGLSGLQIHLYNLDSRQEALGS
jgi:hypothetical protein